MKLSTFLSETISQYKKLESECVHSDLSSALSGLLKDLGQIQQTLELSSYHALNSIAQDRLKALKEIFSFYARQLKMLGNSPTFDEITDHKNLLNISKFIKFCADFNITNKRNPDYITVQQATQAFLNGNKCSRSMNCDEFIISIDSLADMYYNSKYDHRNNTNVSIFSIDRKRNLFYEFLRLDDRTEYINTLKGFGLPFSKEKAGYRLPDYDLSKNYKFRDQTKQKVKISLWKKAKQDVNTEIRSVSVPNPARIAAVQNSLLQRKDRVTWDLLKNSLESTLITKEDLGALFTEADIKEILSNKNIL
jgi:hypothetical protein